MPITPEERARIARENGARSRGPVTPEGKERSSRNALKTGEHATKFSAFYPPHFAVVANENSTDFEDLHCKYIEIYQPGNQLAHEVVRDLATARWQIERLQVHLSLHWNAGLFAAGQTPLSVPAELADLEYATRASTSLLGGSAILVRLNREIVRLQKHTLFLQRQLKFVHEHYPRVVSSVQTQLDSSQAVENTEIETEIAGENKPAVYVTEDNPTVIAAYRREFPNHKIVILPPDNVAKGIDDAGELPSAPRRVA